MGEATRIPWAHNTFNPWWGCVEVSEACAKCYARAWDKRVGGEHWGEDAPRRFFGEAHWREPMKWNAKAAAAGVRERVFCSSMADVFESRDDLVEWRDKLWALIRATLHLDWLLLTKRPENIARMLPPDWGMSGYENVWLGVTAETQRWADERIPKLIAVPAVVHFVSCEPALERVDFSGWTQIHWIIIGGESGPRSRPFDPEWARDVVRQCRASDAAPFVKQMGANPVGLHLRDAKGEDPDEWPEDLRVREFPAHCR